MRRGFACAGTLKQQFEAVQQHAVDRSLQFDPACARQILVSAVLHRGCQLESSFYQALAECGGGCAVFRGDVPSGGACVGAGEIDASAYTNACVAADEFCQTHSSTCELPNETVLGLDEACITAEFVRLGECGEGLWCSLELLVCVPLVGEGEACGGFAQCEHQLACDAGACQPRRPAGAACESDLQCVSIACDGGVCRDEPVICLADSPSDLLYQFTL